MKRGTYPERPTGLALRAKMALFSVMAIIGIMLLVAVGLFMTNAARIGGADYQKIIKNKAAIQQLYQLNAALYQINSETNNLILDPNLASAEKKIAAINKLSREVERNFSNLIAAPEMQEKLAAISKASSLWKEYQKTLSEELLPQAARSDIAKAGNLISGIQAQRATAFSSAINLLVEQVGKDVASFEQSVANSVSTKMAVSIVIGIILIGLIVIFAYLITTSVNRALVTCVDFTRAVAEGRLDIRMEVRAGGVIADLVIAMNSMAENLNITLLRVGGTAGALAVIDRKLENSTRQVVASALAQEKFVKETSQAVVQINTSIHEVNAGIDKLSESATETSASSLEMAATIEEIAMSAEKLSEAVEEVSTSITEMASSIKEIGSNIVNLLDASTMTASSIAEMDATIRQVEKNAMDSASISETVRSDAEIGKNAVLEAITGMQAIRDSSQITSEVVETLSLRVNDIGAILSVIDEVAEQTNLLALNAAIIAAQAGEHGKGFAVVADEIRELAERTSSSTREIAAVIKGVQEETRRAVEAISKAEESIATGEKLSQRSGAALEKIVAGVQRAGIQVGEIAKATVEQARGSQSIREAMESVEEMVESIASSSRENSRGTDMISAAVGRMKDLTIHVSTSTREQSRASNLIAQSTEDATAMVDQIRDACRSQVDCSALISKSVKNIETATIANSLATKVMDTAVTDLTGQINLLEKEMAGFKI